MFQKNNGAKRLRRRKNAGGAGSLFDIADYVFELRLAQAGRDAERERKIAVFPYSELPVTDAALQCDLGVSDAELCRVRIIVVIAGNVAAAGGDTIRNVCSLAVIVNLGKVSPVGAVFYALGFKWQSLRRAYLEADLFGKLVKARAFLNPVGYLYGRR